MEALFTFSSHLPVAKAHKLGLQRGILKNKISYLQCCVTTSNPVSTQIIPGLECER
jgi:hypothetical protein